MSQNLTNQELNNLSLTCYNFHLRNSINSGEKTVADAHLLWEQLSKLGQKLNIPELTNLISHLICYQNDQYFPEAEDSNNQEYFSLLHNQEESLDFQFHTANQLDIKGFLCPYRLHDTYVIDLTLISEKSLIPDKLQALELSYHLQPSLGRTLLLYAKPSVSLNDYATLADICASQLLSHNPNIKLTGKGSLLNSPIFSYENKEIDPLKHSHIIIWFNSHPHDLEQIDEVNEYLLYLLWTRHKILYAYHQSIICVTNTQKRHTEIEEKINQFSTIAQSTTRLQEFKFLLTQLPQKYLEYSQLLRELEDHKKTIQINQQNYKKFSNKLERLPNSDVSFLQSFLHQSRYHFQQQIDADLSFLNPGKSLFHELLDNIRGIVNIDQLESDRQFQIDLRYREEQFAETLQQKEQQWQEQLRQQDEQSQRREKIIELWIAFFGTGLAVSGVSAGVITEPGKTIVRTLAINPPFFCKGNELAKLFCSNSFDIIFHVMVGIIFAIPVAILIGFIQKYLSAK